MMKKYKCIKEFIGLIGEPFHVGTIWNRKFCFEFGSVYLVQGKRKAIINKDGFKKCFEKVN